MGLFDTFLPRLEAELKAKSSDTVGRTHGLVDSEAYQTRIEAVNYALANDDGAGKHNYAIADTVLVGVSRCGKTPTCLYLALQFGILAANYPFVAEDIDNLKLPDFLKNNKTKLFGLTIDPVRLSAIRSERRPNSTYASLTQCRLEVREIEVLFQKENIPFLDTTSYSIEEISTKLLAQTGIERRGV